MFINLIAELNNTQNKLIELQGEIDKSVFKVKDVNTPLLIVDKISRQVISMRTEYLNKINQLDLINIFSNSTKQQQNAQFFQMQIEHLQT